MYFCFDHWYICQELNVSKLKAFLDMQKQVSRAKIKYSYAHFKKGQFRAITGNAYDTMIAKHYADAWNQFTDQDKRTFMKALARPAFEKIKEDASMDAVFKRAAVMVATKDRLFLKQGLIFVQV